MVRHERIWGAAVMFSCIAALLAACGSGSARNDSSDSGDGGSSVSGTTSKAGNSSAGKQSGGSASGGKQSGGSASGGSAGSMPSGCHDASECPEATTPPLGGISMCLSPGQAAPAGACGAPQWCGQCVCPPPPVPATGNGMVCQTSADCPQPTPQMAAASVCAELACTECTTNEDCPELRPLCTTVLDSFASPSFRQCAACITDLDCPSERPHCRNQSGAPRCVACLTNAECELGVCDAGSCQPGCGPEKPCGPVQECGPQQRCEPLRCEQDAGCPANYACTGGRCGRRSCMADSACEGYCVNGSCFDDLGTCFMLLAVP